MNIFSILIIGAMLAVLASLAIGLFFMMKGSDSARKNSQKMMRLRIVFQGLALVLFIFAMLMQGH